MTLIALAGVKGAPGASTCALLLARALSEERAEAEEPGTAGDRMVLLAECDPAGGDLAPRLGLSALPGLASLALVSRHGIERWMLLEHSQSDPALGRARLLPGVAGPDQVIALSWIFPDLAAKLSAVDLDAVVDLGRIGSSPNGAMALLRSSAVMLLAVVDSVSSLLHARTAADIAGQEGAELGLVVVGPRHHSLTEITRATGVNVTGTIGFDPRALSALMHPAGTRRRAVPARKNPLLVDAGRIAASVRTGPPLPPLRGAEVPDGLRAGLAGGSR